MLGYASKTENGSRRWSESCCGSSTKSGCLVWPSQTVAGKSNINCNVSVGDQSEFARIGLSREHVRDQSGVDALFYESWTLQSHRRPKRPRSEQGQAVNWDDIIIDAAATDTGMRRANNQDSFTSVRASHAAAWRQRGHVFMVADGMGAHAVGELASKMACDLIPHTYLKARTGTAPEAITKAFREVSSLIYSRASANRDFQGMGTTVLSRSCCFRKGALISHVGEFSGFTGVRRNRIDQLSFDHSLVWELVRRNHLDIGTGERQRSQEYHHPESGAGGRSRGRHRRAAGRGTRRRFSALLRRTFGTGRRP